MFFFDPPENIRKSKVFWYFQGDQKGTLGRKRSYACPVHNTFLQFIFASLLHYIYTYVMRFRDLVPLVQFQKREKHPWRRVNLQAI